MKIWKTNISKFEMKLKVFDLNEEVIVPFKGTAKRNLKKGQTKREEKGRSDLQNIIFKGRATSNKRKITEI